MGEKKRKKESEKNEKKEKDDELKRLLAMFMRKRVRDSTKRLPLRRTGGGRPAPKIFGFPHFPRIPSEPKPKINPIPKLERMPRQFYWSEPKPKAERVIIRNEPDAEQLLKALEKNPKLYEKLSKKLLERMNEDFDKQLEAINDSEKLGKEQKSIEDEKGELSFEEFAKRYPLEFEGKELLSEDTRQEIMRRAYENYLGNKLVERLTDSGERDSDDVNEEHETRKEFETIDKTEKEESDASIKDEQREILESLGITPDEEGKVELGEVLEKLGEEEGMGIFPLGELEVEEKESEVDDKVKELEAEVQIEKPEAMEQVEPQPNVLTQLESQDLSILEAELIQPEIEAEPKVEKVEPEEPY